LFDINDLESSPVLSTGQNRRTRRREELIHGSLPVSPPHSYSQAYSPLFDINDLESSPVLSTGQNRRTRRREELIHGSLPLSPSSSPIRRRRRMRPSSPINMQNLMSDI
jgi:hypothetical protein